MVSQELWVHQDSLDPQDHSASQEVQARLVQTETMVVQEFPVTVVPPVFLAFQDSPEALEPMVSLVDRVQQASQVGFRSLKVCVCFIRLHHIRHKRSIGINGRHTNSACFYARQLALRW